MTDAQVIAAGIACDCRTLPLEYVPRALVNRDTRGLIKLVAQAGTGRLLGVHAIAEGAGEIITAAVYAITAGLTVDQLARTWHPYLTMAQGQAGRRSEEHTSELQSHLNLVCRLLL